MRIAVIGGGNMGSAMTRAFFRNKLVQSADVCFVEPDAEKRAALAEEFGCQTLDSCSERLREYDFILLAVKPQIAIKVMQTLKSGMDSKQVVMSIMAGVSIKTISEILNPARVVRVMPNTPSQIGEGMSAYYAESSILPEEKQTIAQLLEACGKCIEVPDESWMDAVTAVSGSGPAYLFYLAEQMVSAALAFGFNETDAFTMVAQTLKGAVLLWENSGISPQILRKQVTSPGGTTEAALNVFEARNVGPSIQQGIQRACERSRELSRQ
ncbi:MAG: pyrroline-5-carboxylate reductase [SAR324 cluster bacterium]|nr:pyrroline-5-carboxylate reductase [SAR324 cluster bacterium]